MYMYTHIYAYMCTDICMCRYMCMLMYVHDTYLQDGIYIYIYTYVRTHEIYVCFLFFGFKYGKNSKKKMRTQIYMDLRYIDPQARVLNYFYK